jgi:murein tripeptide amidase MpaA
MRRATRLASNVVFFFVMPFILTASLVFLVSCKKVAEAPGRAESVDWNRYYSNDETNQIMRSYADRFPKLTRLYSIGKSYKGADLMLMEVTNQDTGPAEDKPALYMDGNIHSGELTGSAVTLYMIGYLLDRYGKDPEVTGLVDSRAFYLRPKFNPDGADLALLKDVSLRSTVRPWDDDNDDTADEDPAEDLNGDGLITQMRIPDPEGNMKISSEDPRLMVRRDKNETGGSAYRVVGEGVDNDHDGRLNEDGIGGIDLNRNFSRNWEPEYLQPGAGPFPLSEPETYATIKFIDGHPNIMSIVHNHTSGGFVYRLPSSSDPTQFNKDDLALIETLGAKYTEITGRPVQPSSTDPVKHRYGTLIGWAYEDRGIIGWVPEYWPGVSADYDGDGTTSELERLRFNDEKLGGKYFVAWKPFDHPEFGKVEIGGWRSRFISQNPPPQLLEKECALQIPWLFYLAKQSPFIKMTDPAVTDLGEGKFQVEVTVCNEGFLPTNLTERGIQAKLIKPVYASITIDGGELVEGKRRIELDHLAGTYAVPDPARKSSASARWIARTTSGTATIRIEARSEKGGTVRLGPITLPLRRLP